MEKQLTNEEIEKVFVMYWEGYAVCPPSANRISIKSILCNYHIGDEITKYRIDGVPLSKISNEDAIEVAKMLDQYDSSFKVDLFKDRCLFKWALSRYPVVQYLISKCYAVPLFFTPNHWANGRTAIELGIAIDKTKTNNDVRQSVHNPF